jgi:hypothetical protein
MPFCQCSHHRHLPSRTLAWAAAELSTVNRKASIYELTTAIGVLRAAAPPAAPSPVEAPTTATMSTADGDARGVPGMAQPALPQPPQQPPQQPQQQEKAQPSQGADEAPS